MACRFDFYNHRQGLAQVRQSAQNRVGRLNEWDWHKLGGRLEIELAGLTSGLGADWMVGSLQADSVGVHKLSGRLEIQLASLTSSVGTD